MKTKLTLLFLFTLFVFGICAQQNKDTTYTVYSNYENPPSFVGGNSGLLKYIYTELRYPEEAFKDSIQGKVICRFTIDELGEITDLHSLSDSNPLLINEAFRILENMPDWVPATTNGQAVKATQTVPIAFSFERESQRIFPEDDVDTKPEFYGGAANVLNFLAQNIRYPVNAQKKGIAGKVECDFIVEPNGNITNPSLVKSVHPLLDNEALRVISLMPNWIPGKIGNRNVRVLVKMPVIFRIGGSMK